MRGWMNWAGSFFKAPEKSSPEKYKIYLSSGNLAQYPRVKLLDYDEIYLNSFDFRRETGERNFLNILPELDPRYIFLQAEFTADQIKTLLERGFDLSRSTYRVYPAIKITEYKTLYHIANQKNLLNSLHGIYVDFSAVDLQNFSPDFVGSCYPFSFQGTKLTQEQFDFLIQYRSPRSLNLTGISLDEIDISECIRVYQKIISFSPYQLTSGLTTIGLAQTSLENTIIDIEILARLTNVERFHAWFNQTNLSIVIKNRDCYFGINIPELLSNIESQPHIQSITPRLNSGATVFNQFKEYLADHYKLSSSNEYNQLSQAEKFLGLMLYMVNNPNALLTKYVWRIHPEIILHSPQLEANLL